MGDKHLLKVYFLLNITDSFGNTRMRDTINIGKNLQLNREADN